MCGQGAAACLQRAPNSRASRQASQAVLWMQGGWSAFWRTWLPPRRQSEMSGEESGEEEDDNSADSAPAGVVVRATKKGSAARPL